MHTDALDAEGIADAIVRDGVAPACAAGCASKTPAGWRTELGGAVGTFFDLASLTKSMTAVAVARAGLDLHAPLRDFLPEVASTPSADVPLELFLAHRAGLEPHVALFEPLVRGLPVDPRAALVAAANARRSDAPGAPPPEGFAPVYSDMGYLLAGEALARATGSRDAGEAIARLVVAPLGLEGELGTARELEERGVDLRRDAAPTEDAPWRGGIVRGRVHDENAWAIAGAGGAGHAGMFGTLRAVLDFGRGVLDALVLDAAPLGARGGLTCLVTPRAGGTLRAGFDGKSEEGSSAGALASARTFGHLGFTGTSLWIDPATGAVVVLLTNRVHPTRDHIAIRAARPRAHDALFARARSLDR